MDTINKANGANLGWGMWLDAAGRAYGLFYGGGVSVLQGISVIVNKWSHVLMTAQGTVGRLFVDGLQEDRKAVTMSSADAVNLYIGGPGFAAYYNGSIELPQVWNGALSPEQVYKNYLQAKDVPIYYDTFESYAVTPVAKAAGSMCGPFMVTANSLLITVDAAGKKWVQGGVVGFNYGVGDWTEDNAYGTWEFDWVKGEDATDTPYFGIICNTKTGYGTAGLNGYMFASSPTEAVVFYRITNGAVAVVPMVSVAPVVVVGTAYRFRITRRVGGQFTLYIKGGAFSDWTLVDCSGTGTTNPATDNTYTSGQFFNTVVRASDKISGILRTRTCERPASFPWEFLSGTYAGIVSGSTIWMRCITAGVTYQPFDGKPGTYEFGVYKGADANVADTLFGTEILGATGANQNGYGVRLSSDERVQLIRMDAGVVTVVAQTAAAYVALATEYRLTVTWSSASSWSIWIQGGAYTAKTLAIGPVTDATYTQTLYLLHDLDADDRVVAPVYNSGIVAV
jgi:hypothetical protein